MTSDVWFKEISNIIKAMYCTMLDIMKGEIAMVTEGNRVQPLMIPCSDENKKGRSAVRVEDRV